MRCLTAATYFYVLLLFAARFSDAQFVAQVFIEPTIDPSSVFASVSTLSGPVQGVRRSGWQDGPGQGARYFHPAGVAPAGVDGTVYVADVRNHVIRRVYWSGWAETLAGSAGKPGLVDGEQSAARFYNPSAVAVGPEGEVYVADSGNHAVRRVSPAGVVTTLFAGRSYVTAEMRMGAKAPLGLWNPCGIAAWATAAGTLRLVVADTDNHRILWLTPPGVTPKFKEEAGAATAAAPPAAPGQVSASAASDGAAAADATAGADSADGTGGGGAGTASVDGTAAAGGGGDSAGTATSGGGGSDSTADGSTGPSPPARRLQQGPKTLSNSLADDVLPGIMPAVVHRAFRTVLHLLGVSSARAPARRLQQPGNSSATDDTSAAADSGTAAATGTAGSEGAGASDPNATDVAATPGAATMTTAGGSAGSITPASQFWRLSYFAGVRGMGGLADGDALGRPTVDEYGRPVPRGAMFRSPRGIALCTIQRVVMQSRRRRLQATGGDAAATGGDAAAGGDDAAATGDGAAAATGGDDAVATGGDAAAGAGATASGDNGTAASAGTGADTSAVVPPLPPGTDMPLPPPPPGTITITEYHVAVADTGNHAIRSIRHDAATDTVRVVTLAGSGFPGRDDSRTRREKPKASVLLTSILNASFTLPMAVACGDPQGGVLVADTANHRIRQVRSDGVTVTIAGGDTHGLTDGEGPYAHFNGPSGITADETGTRFIVVDGKNSALRNMYLNSEALKLTSTAPRGRAGRTSAGAVTAVAAMLLATAALTPSWSRARESGASRRSFRRSGESHVYGL